MYSPITPIADGQSCPKCGINNPPNHLYCTACGIRLIDASPPAEVFEQKKTNLAFCATMRSDVKNPTTEVLENKGNIQARLFPRWLLITALVAGLLCIMILVTVGFGVYQASLDQREFAAGMDAYRATDCRTAMQHFNRITGFRLLPLSSADLAIAQARTTECGLLIFAENSQMQARYAETLAAYEAYLRLYPQGIFWPKLQETIVESYKQWATQLWTDGQYQDAIQTYQLILDKYPDSSTGKQATTLIAEVYGDWAIQLWTDSQYEQATETYQILLSQYPDTSRGRQAADLIAQVYNAWGGHLHTQQDYLTAMDKFNQAQTLAVNPETLATAQQGYDEALWALSQDTGPLGKRIIQETWIMICQGQPATSPAVGLARDESGRLWFGESALSLPDDLRAINPGHFRFSVCLEEGVKEIERCEYGFIGQGIVIRQQSWWRVTLRDTRTATVVHQNTFNGSQPPRCVSTETFPSWGGTKHKTGDDPSSDEVNAWLEKWGH